MSHIKTFILFIILLFCGLATAQVADHPVIAEIYGGGGNTGSYFMYDYIILYNPTVQNIDLSGWSLQYASATSSNWSVTNLEGTINAESYFIIQQKGGTKGGEELPKTPDIIGTTSLATTSGKVALVANQDELAVNDPSGNVNVIDFVGYGSADSFEGTAAASSPSNTESIRRLDNNGEQTMNNAGSGYDSNDNSADFFVAVTDAGNPPLPVELISFSIDQINGLVILNWVTATEVNNYGFEIERVSNPSGFKDGIIPVACGEWENIGFIKGSGNSNNSNKYTFKDNNIRTSFSYAYRLKQIDTDGKYKYSRLKFVSVGSPNKFKLCQNFPNPFNPVTKIRYSIPDVGTHVNSSIQLVVYDILGRKIATLVNKKQQPGNYEVNFEGSNLTSGIYLYRLKTNNFTITKSMILVK